MLYYESNITYKGRFRCWDTIKSWAEEVEGEEGRMEVKGGEEDGWNWSGQGMKIWWNKVIARPLSDGTLKCKNCIIFQSTFVLTQVAHTFEFIHSMVRRNRDDPICGSSVFFCEHLLLLDIFSIKCYQKLQIFQNIFMAKSTLFPVYPIKYNQWKNFILQKIPFLLIQYHNSLFRI